VCSTSTFFSIVALNMVTKLCCIKDGCLLLIDSCWRDSVDSALIDIQAVHSAVLADDNRIANCCE